jgi:hypothetical protein
MRKTGHDGPGRADDNTHPSVGSESHPDPMAVQSEPRYCNHTWGQRGDCPRSRGRHMCTRFSPHSGESHVCNCGASD